MENEFDVSNVSNTSSSNLIDGALMSAWGETTLSSKKQEKDRKDYLMEERHMRDIFNLEIPQKKIDKWRMRERVRTNCYWVQYFKKSYFSNLDENCFSCDFILFEYWSRST